MKFNRRRNIYSVLKRIFRKILLVLIIIVIPCVMFLFTFSIKKVDVIGTSRYSAKQIRETIMQSELDNNSVYLYLKYRFFKKPVIPFIEKIEVEMVSSHKVAVYVYDKIVTGCVHFMGEYLYFDKDGIVVESSSKRIEKIPIIKGLQFEKIILHEKLEAQNDKLFNVILNLTKLINKYKLDVDIISFDSEENVTLHCEDIEVLLGKKEDYYDALSNLNNILTKAKGKHVYELDMRNYEKGAEVIAKFKKSTQ